MASRIARRIVAPVMIFPNRVISAGGDLVTYPGSVPEPNERYAAMPSAPRPGRGISVKKGAGGLRCQCPGFL